VIYMLKRRDYIVLSHLRENGRASLTELSRKTHIPTSTIFDKIRFYHDKFIQRNTVLIDFSEVGYFIRANVALKAHPKHKELLKKYLFAHLNVNSMYHINNGFDYLVECIFKNIRELEDFLVYVDEKFKIKNKHVHYLISDIKREMFMADPNTVDLLL